MRIRSGGAGQRLYVVLVALAPAGVDLNRTLPLGSLPSIAARTGCYEGQAARDGWKDTAAASVTEPNSTAACVDTNGRNGSGTLCVLP